MKSDIQTIPVCEPYLNGNELEYVADCIRTGWISSQGKYVEEFERKFAEYCGCKHGIAVTNGTTALHLALTTLGIGQEDEVIVPTFTMVASAFAVAYTGAKIRLIDCNDTGCMDVSKIEANITSRTRVIMPVHIYGQPCDMWPILSLALEHNLYVIEDAAEAHGAECGGHRVGGLSHIGCFSFYANKIITTGEGGMLVTNSDDIAQQARYLRDMAHSPKQRFYHTDIGFNYRMTNIQAAIGLAQLEKIDEHISKRRAIAETYTRALTADIHCSLQPLPQRVGTRPVCWMYGAVSTTYPRDKLMLQLQERGIGTRPFFIPMHCQPALKCAVNRNGNFPKADYLSEKGLYLPSGTGLTPHQIGYIIDTIKEILP